MNHVDNIQKAKEIAKRRIDKAIEVLFNQAFYLLTSQDIRNKRENFYQAILKDSNYLRKRNFSFYPIEWDASEYETAERIFSAIIQIKPNFHFAYAFRGIAKDRMVLEIVRLESLKGPPAGVCYGDFELEPDDKAWHEWMDTERKRAYQDILYSLKINPNFADAYLLLSEISYNSEYKKTLYYCSKAIKIDPEYALAFKKRGECNYELGKYRNAERDLTKALELDPTLLSIFETRAKSRHKLGKLNEALNDFIISHKVDKKNIAILNAIAEIFDKKGEFFEAIQYLNKVLKINPSLWYILIERARLKEKIGNLRGAQNDLKRAETIRKNQ